MDIKDNLLLSIDSCSKVSDRQLSKLISGSTDTIRNIRRGASPRLDTVQNICNTLNLELSISPRRKTDFSVSDIPADVAKDMNHDCIKQAVVLTEKIVAKIKTPVDPEKKANLIDKIYTRLWTRQVARYLESQKTGTADKPEHFDDSVIEIVQDIISDLLLEAA